jgi:hypothetical protein
MFRKDKIQMKLREFLRFYLMYRRYGNSIVSSLRMARDRCSH